MFVLGSWAKGTNTGKRARCCHYSCCSCSVRETSSWVLSESCWNTRPRGHERARKHHKYVHTLQFTCSSFWSMPQFPVFIFIDCLFWNSVVSEVFKLHMEELRGMQEQISKRDNEIKLLEAIIQTLGGKERLGKSGLNGWWWCVSFTCRVCENSFCIIHIRLSLSDDKKLKMYFCLLVRSYRFSKKMNFTWACDCNGPDAFDSYLALDAHTCAISFHTYADSAPMPARFRNSHLQPCGARNCDNFDTWRANFLSNSPKGE